MRFSLYTLRSMLIFRFTIIMLFLFLINNISFADNYEVVSIPMGDYRKLLESTFPECSCNGTESIWEYRAIPAKLFDEDDYKEKYGKKRVTKPTGVDVKLRESFTLNISVDMRKYAVEGYYLDKDVTIDRNASEPYLSFAHYGKPNSDFFNFSIYIDTDVKKIKSGNRPEVVVPNFKNYYTINGKKLTPSFKVVVTLSKKVLFESSLSDSPRYSANYRVDKHAFFNALSDEKTFSVSVVDVKGVFAYPGKTLFSQQFGSNGLRKAMIKANGNIENTIFLFRNLRCKPYWSLF